MYRILWLFAIVLLASLPAVGEVDPMRSLPAGEFRCGPADFRTGEPFVLTGTQRGNGEPVRTVELPGNTSGNALYLLHALEDRSFGQLGAIEVRFADGSRQLIPVSAEQDCGDWREASSRGNAVVARRLPGHPLFGWYATGFRLNRDDPRFVTFTVTAKKARWLVVAVAAGKFAPLPPEPRCVINADDRHLPITYRWGTVRNSALDFSGLNDAPAGKYGFVRATPEGHFSFENAPEKQIRFFGTNIVYHANFPDREMAVRIADELARTGCNLARFHLNDDLMLKKDAETSLEIDPAQLDRLEFLAAKLKERGVYFTIDLYGCRRFRKGDGAELFAEPAPMAMKYVSLLSPAARENLKEFARRWLTHVNPYTGIAWKDEPAIAFLNLLNEDDAESVWYRSEPFRRRFIDAFRRDTGKTNLEIPPRDPPREFVAWLNEIQSGVLDELTGFVRRDLGMKVLITSLNSAHRPAVTPLREKFDLVDNHQYHDHPRYSPNYRLPWHFRQVSAIATVLPDPWRVMPTRIFGKPFVMTEFNFCHPNVFRAEGGPLTAAYASLQDHSGLVHYRWASDDGDRETAGNFRIGAFSGNTDPLNLCTNRIIAFLFRRGLVKPAAERYAAPVPDSFAEAAEMHYSLPQRYFWLFAQIGSGLKSRSSLPDPDRVTDPRIAALQRQFRETGVAESSTGEIRLDSRRNTFTLTAPEVLSVVLPEGSQKAGTMQVGGADGFQSVTLIAVDGQPIERSRRLLLFHLTDVTNSGIAFSDGSRTEVVEKGTLPLLLRRGSCRVTLAGRQAYRVVALGLDGAESGDVPGAMTGEGFSFPLDNFIYGGCFAYLLERKEK